MNSAFPRVKSAVLALDDWLCRRQHVYAFTDDPQCLFRIQFLQSDDTLELSDGTCIRPGGRILALHLWSEHIPHMGSDGPTLAWARRVDRAVEASLRALAGYLAVNPSLGDVIAICADMRLGGAHQTAQFARIATRYGFESAGRDTDRRGILRRMGDTILIAMLVLATNARALRSAPLRMRSARYWLSRTVLDKYGRRRAANPDSP